MDIFLAVLPAIFWGSIVLFNVKLGGGPYSQTLGTTLGALIFLHRYLYFCTPYAYTFNLWGWSCIGAILGSWTK